MSRGEVPCKAYQKFICTISFPFQASPCCHPRECRKKVVEIFFPCLGDKVTRHIFPENKRGSLQKRRGGGGGELPTFFTGGALSSSASSCCLHPATYGI